MNTEKKLSRAKLLLDQGNLTEAVDILHKIHHLKPKNLLVLNYLAMINLRINNLSNAIDFLKKFLDVKFDLACMSNLMLAYQDQKDWASLIQLYEHWSEKYQLTVDIRILAAKAYRENKDYDKSINLFEDLYKEDSKNINLILSYSYTLNQNNKFNEALNILLEGNKFDPKDFNILYNLGITYGNVNDYDNSIKFLLKAAEIKEDDINIWLNLAAQASFLKDEKKTKDFLDAALKIDSNNPQVHVQYGAINMACGRLDDALNNFKRAISCDHHNVEANYHLGLIYLMKSDYKKAMPHYAYRTKRMQPAGFFDDFELRKNINKQDKLVIGWEQGIGDQLLYSRLLSSFSKKFNNLTYITSDKLYKFLNFNFPNINIIKDSDKADYLKNNNYDYAINAASMINYLDNINDALKDSFKLKPSNPCTIEFSRKYKIGISWTSKSERNSFNKSISLELLNPILSIDESQIINLQYGDVKNIIEQTNHNLNYPIYYNEDLDYFNDIDGLAALIDRCDIVVTTSNVTAHIAGSLGKKTLILLPYSSGRLWYWHEESMQSNWYPNSELFIQKNNDEKWEVVIDKVKNRVKELLAINI